MKNTHNAPEDTLPFYARLWNGRIQPAYERLRGRITPRLERELAASQWASWEENEDRRWKDLQALLVCARDNVAFYRDWFRKSSVDVADIVRNRDLGSLPLTNRDMMVADGDQFRSQNPPRGSFRKTTGGTTGAPFGFLVSMSSSQWRLAMSRRGYSWAGCVPGRRQVHVWSSDVVPPPLFKRLKRSLHRILMRQRYISSFGMIDRENVKSALLAIDNCRPDCMVAYPSSAEVLARHVIETGFPLRTRLVSVIGGGEAVFPSQREVIEEAFRCPVFETYGNREFMLIAAECEEHNGLHISAENLVVEVIKEGCSAGPGEIGEIVVTDLHNFAQPFIRYRTGDLGVWAEGECACGRAAPRLLKVEGRELDVIRGPGGQRLTGHFLPHFVQDFEVIDRFQVVQDRPDHVVIRVVLNGSLSERERAFIISQVEDAVPGIHAEVRQVERIELTASGKQRVTIGLKE